MHTIFRSIKRAHHRSLEFQRNILFDHGISPARYEMLFVLEHAPFGGMTQSDLRCALGVSRMTVSRMIRALENTGFVERRQSLLDRRQIDLALTKLATTLLRTIERALIEPGIVWIALYTVLGMDGKGPGALKHHLDILRSGFRDACTFDWPWCDRTMNPQRFKKRPPPPFEWPERKRDIV